jgi:hypothetical protein
MGWLADLFRSHRPMSPPEVVRFYQELGFLLSEAPDAILRRYEEEMGDPLDPVRPWDDAYLLSFDRDRVWSDDPECDLCAESRDYSRVLREWSHVSGGVFVPRDIEERWDSETGPIAVHFTLNGVRHSVRPEYLDDYFDLAILTEINRLMTETGRQFACAWDLANFAIVFAIDADGRRRLRDVRQFPFLL